MSHEYVHKGDENPPKILFKSYIIANILVCTSIIALRLSNLIQLHILNERGKF